METPKTVITGEDLHKIALGLLMKFDKILALPEEKQLELHNALKVLNDAIQKHKERKAKASAEN